MKHVNTILNPTQASNLKKVLDLAIFKTAGNEDTYLLRVADVKELKELLL